MLSNAEDELANALRLVIARLARRLRQQSHGGLTPSQRSALSTLDRHGPLNMTDLAAVEGISAPSASGIVKRLCDRGLVVRHPDARDGRVIVVEPTVEGEIMLRQLRSERTAFIASRLGDLSEQERATLVEATEILSAMVEER